MLRASAILGLLSLSTLAGAQQPPALTGAGATFPQPLYASWIELYQGLERVAIGYEPVGSGEGIRLFLERRVDFGATDAFLSDDELAEVGRAVLHVPTCIGAVAVAYNLPGTPRLRLSPDLVANIYLGRIRRWSDPRIVDVNPTAELPDLAIRPVHRGDASGTTALFTDFLTRATSAWRSRVGSGRQVGWPTGISVQGNEGVAQEVAGTPGAIGYLEVNYADRLDLPVAAIRNQSGFWVLPELEAVAAAARVPLPSDTRISLTDTAAPEGYPIAGFSYLLVFQEQGYDQRGRARASTLADFLWWAIHDGQVFSEELRYAPLPGNAVDRAEAAVRAMTWQGRPLIGER